MGDFKEGNVTNENRQLAVKEAAIREELDPKQSTSARAMTASATRQALEDNAERGTMCLDEDVLRTMKTTQLHSELQVWTKVRKPIKEGKFWTGKSILASVINSTLTQLGKGGQAASKIKRLDACLIFVEKYKKMLTENSRRPIDN